MIYLGGEVLQTLYGYFYSILSLVRMLVWIDFLFHIIFGPFSRNKAQIFVEEMLSPFYRVIGYQVVGMVNLSPLLLLFMIKFFGH